MQKGKAVSAKDSSQEWRTVCSAKIGELRRNGLNHYVPCTLNEAIKLVNDSRKKKK